MQTSLSSTMLVRRSAHPGNTLVSVGDVVIGGLAPVIMAGPCAVESKDAFLTAARAAKEAGAQILRGGVFKPRTSPYSFQGLGYEGLRLLSEAREETGLPVITEVMAPNQVEAIVEVADILQVGSRNMANFPLLIACGKQRQKRPVLLKRGQGASIDEWLYAAEYILHAGNPHVILCERGINGFGAQFSYTRNLLDLSCVPVLHELTHLPVIVDPSHATGKRELVPLLAVAAIEAGAHGLMMEMHPSPWSAHCDGPQSITPAMLKLIVSRVHELTPMHEAFAREIHTLSELDRQREDEECGTHFY